MQPEDIHLREIRDECGLRQSDVCEVIERSDRLSVQARNGLQARKRQTAHPPGPTYQRHPWDFYTLRGFPLPRQRQTDVCVLCGSTLSGGSVAPSP